ncbi:Histone chaperone asf1 [Trichinella britovi]|uniref:Histone chaperone asf1 n=1 Tax=Trichinella britovi TaxID=45882 RepID=A0A0V1CKX3_TRIBR|nr:Histone chaperone asf1 [Trichinella britovi]KRY50138.1 Histone chaperone asf1 [Trichinella britovi]
MFVLFFVLSNVYSFRMSLVEIQKVDVLNNPGTFFTPFKFGITLLCHEDLPHDLEFTLTFIGSPDTHAYDQELETVLVGPIKEGFKKFFFETDPPDPTKIPATEAAGVSVILLSVSYREQIFVKIGYYVSHFYADVELSENPPLEPKFQELSRLILITDVPRITKYVIDWTKDSGEATSNDMECTMDAPVEETAVDNEKLDTIFHHLPIAADLMQNDVDGADSDMH